MMCKAGRHQSGVSVQCWFDVCYGLTDTMHALTIDSSADANYWVSDRRLPIDADEKQRHCDGRQDRRIDSSVSRHHDLSSRLLGSLHRFEDVAQQCACMGGMQC
jgi:hypothetical protein